MKSDNVNTISTALISFITIIGLMVGFYYNAKSFNTNLIYIILFELMFILAVFIFILWIKRKIKNDI